MIGKVRPGSSSSQVVVYWGKPDLSIALRDSRLLAVYLHRESSQGEGITYTHLVGRMLWYTSNGQVSDSRSSNSKDEYQRMCQFVTCCKKLLKDVTHDFQETCWPIVSDFMKRQP